MLLYCFCAQALQFCGKFGCRLMPSRCSNQRMASAATLTPSSCITLSHLVQYLTKPLSCRQLLHLHRWGASARSCATQPFFKPQPPFSHMSPKKHGAPSQFLRVLCCSEAEPMTRNCCSVPMRARVCVRRAHSYTRERTCIIYTQEQHKLWKMKLRMWMQY